MADFLRTKGSTEIINKKLPKSFVPYYRFHIKNSNPSNQFDLLKKAAMNKTNIVRYISPMFHATKNENDEVAFLNFFSSPPEDLNKYICSINFSQFVNSPETKLSKDNSHKICYKLGISSERSGYLFSQPKEIITQKGLEELQEGNLLFTPKQTMSLEKSISEIREIFFKGLDIQFAENNIVSSIQTELIIRHNIFWMPAFLSRSEQLDKKLSTILG